MSKPSWQLPAGVSRGTWDYVTSVEIAQKYDDYIADNPLMRLDINILREMLRNADCHKTVVADLGCGTGRVARELLPLGFEMINVDLSQPMLDQIRASLSPEFSGRSRQLHGSLVDLADLLEPASVDFAVCLFSSIGMIRGQKNRRRFLAATRQILRPGGQLLLHVHNRYSSLFDPGGPAWLTKTWLNSWRSRDIEFGDRVYSYRGLPKMFLHIYSLGELRRDLSQSGFDRIRVLSVDRRGESLLPQRTVLSSLRAGGFLAIANT